MSTTVKRWQMMPLTPLEHLKQYRDLSPILAQVLFNRGMETPQDAYHFLYDKDFNVNPFAMKDMDKAVERITRAIHENESIVVYGDFDADGVTATTLLMQILRRLKANVEAYIPHRVDEGYGLNTPALQELAARGVDLVITVDCGIRSVQEVEDGMAAGLDIIITDHHSCGAEIPNAYAVVNPQQVDCAGDNKIAGVGVAFMVARALLLDAWKRNGSRRDLLPLYQDLIDDLMDLVAIGTVADIMPLNTNLNRALVRRGLDVINAGKRPGLQALLQVAGVKAGQASAMTIGFVIGPRINAAGRLESALTAYELLSAETFEEAYPLAQELQDLNLHRQKLTREAQQRVSEQLDVMGDDDTQLIFAVDDEVLPGIVGLVAGRLTEAFYRPTVVVEQGHDECHASCRSIPQFHITQALDECADLLVRHGGHAMAAGLTILPENLDALRERLQEKADVALAGQDLIPTLMIDMELPIGHLKSALCEELMLLEPTGHENRPPIFVTRNVQIAERRAIGTDKAHLKMMVSDGYHPPIDCIGFRLGHLCDELPDVVDIAYHLEMNEYNGRRNLQLNIQDVRPVEGG